MSHNEFHIDHKKSSNYDYGFKNLAQGNAPNIDIIAIHSLNGHRERSWTHKTSNTLWLRDLLPEAIPQARILTYGYDGDTHGRPQLSCQTVYDYAETFIAKLVAFRRETGTLKRPIIFVAHSLGGIILKSALIHSSSTNKSHLHEHKSVELSTYGIMFFGTPHQGIQLASSGKYILRLGNLFFPTNDRVVKELERDSQTLRESSSRYNAISQNFRTIFFYENRPMVLSFRFEKNLVEKESAIIPGLSNTETIGLDKDHVGMVKFASHQDDDFKTICSNLKKMSSEACGTIDPRWSGYEERSGPVCYNLDHIVHGTEFSGVSPLLLPPPEYSASIPNPGSGLREFTLPSNSKTPTSNGHAPIVAGTCVQSNHQRDPFSKMWQAIAFLLLIMHQFHPNASRSRSGENVTATEISAQQPSSSSFPSKSLGWLVKIQFNQDGKLRHGTGFFIIIPGCSDKVVLTAASNLVDSKGVLGRNAVKVFSATGESVPVSEVKISETYGHNSGEETDYGVLIVQPRLPPSERNQGFPFNLIISCDEFYWQGGRSFVTGYLAERNLLDVRRIIPDACNICSSEIDEHTPDAHAKCNGSPVWVEHNGVLIVLGIHHQKTSATALRTTRLTHNTLREIFKWASVGYFDVHLRAPDREAGNHPKGGIFLSLRADPPRTLVGSHIKSATIFDVFPVDVTSKIPLYAMAMGREWITFDTVNQQVLITDKLSAKCLFTKEDFKYKQMLYCIVITDERGRFEMTMSGSCQIRDSTDNIQKYEVFLGPRRTSATDRSYFEFRPKNYSLTVRTLQWRP